MKKGKVFWVGIVVLLLSLGLILAGCDNGTSSDDSSNSGSEGSQGGDSQGGDSQGGDSQGGDSQGGSQTNTTFTPPTKAKLEEFVENNRKTTVIMNDYLAAVYIKSITVNSYTVNESNITSSPSPVPEDAEVQVKFTLRTILIFDNLSMAERLNIDNYRVSLQNALTTWLKNQGFQSSKIKVTTGNTVFG